MIIGCARPDVESARPPELTGAWVRLRADGTWGDTLQYLADGRVLGSTGHPVPATAQWSVIRSKVAGEAFCGWNAKDRDCQPYRLEGDTLVVGYIQQSPTYLRRAR